MARECFMYTVPAGKGLPAPFSHLHPYNLALPSPNISSIAISLVIKIHVSLKLPTLCL
jgi:hypothetical protein